ncbi:MAG: hypothetical protein AAF840_08710, partial [Bacteroidota bacterium]
REEADKLDKMTEASAESISALTEMTSEEVFNKFFADGKDHWMSFNDVENLGFIKEDEGYEAALRNGEDVEQLSYPELIQQFKAVPPKERQPSVLSRIRKAVASATQATITPQNPEPVNLKDLRDAIANGDITLEQMAEVQEELSTPTQDPQQTLTETMELAVAGAVEEKVSAMTAEIKELKQQLKQLGDKPGAQPTGAGAAGDPGTEKLSAVQKDAAFFGEAARSGKRLFRNPSQEIPVTEG